MSARKMEVLRLYKTLLRESQKFPSYNFRNYFVRRVRDAFRANKMLTSGEEVSKEISRANSSLNVIKRQVIIGQMYQTHKLVIENIPVAKIKL